MKKIILSVIGILLVIVIIAVVVVALNLDRIVKHSIEYYGPQVTKVDVKLDSVHIGIFSGDASIKGLAVGNPPGYQAPHSITVGSASIGIVPSTILKSKIVVRSIKVESPEITFEGGLQQNNLTTIKDNASGNAQKPAQTVTNSVGRQKPEKHLEVDDFLLTGAKVNGTLQLPGGRQVTVNNLTLPEIHLTNLGTDPQGITASELTKRILEEIEHKTVGEVSKLGMNVGKDLLKNLGNGGTNGGVNLNRLKQNFGNLLHKSGTATTNLP